MKYVYSVVLSRFNATKALSYHNELDDALNELIQIHEEKSKSSKIKIIHETKFVVVDNENITREIYEIVLIPNIFG